MLLHSSLRSHRHPQEAEPDHSREDLIILLLLADLIGIYFFMLLFALAIIIHEWLDLIIPERRDQDLLIIPERRDQDLLIILSLFADLISVSPLPLLANLVRISPLRAREILLHPYSS
jgi:hypothetical protein